jgi:type IV pilus assembly protein PilA
MQREHLDARAVRRSERGFTLIELMMVVLIIAILIAVTIPVFFGAANKAKDRATQTSVKTALKAAKGVYTDTTDYTLATPAALTAELGAGSVSFVGAGVSPTGQNRVSVNGVSASYIVLSAHSKSGNCFYASSNETTGAMLYAKLAAAGGCAANTAPVPADAAWQPAW